MELALAYSGEYLSKSHVRRVFMCHAHGRCICPVLGARVSTTETVTAAINFAALVFLGAQVMLARRALREAAVAQQHEWERERRKASIEASVSTARYREGLRRSFRGTTETLKR